jgi:hypothetical protein
MTDTERAQLRQAAAEGHVPMPNTIIELIDEVTAEKAKTVALTDDIEQLRLLLKPIEVNVQALTESDG